MCVTIIHRKRVEYKRYEINGVRVRLKRFCKYITEYNTVLSDAKQPPKTWKYEESFHFNNANTYRGKLFVLLSKPRIIKYNSKKLLVD